MLYHFALANVRPLKRSQARFFKDLECARDQDKALEFECVM